MQKITLTFVVAAFALALNACDTPTKSSSAESSDIMAFAKPAPQKSTASSDITGSPENEVSDAKVWADAAKYDKPFTFAQSTREKLMLREINMVRANPKAYVEFVQEYLRIQERGMAIPRTPTISTATRIANGKKTVKRDTVWTGGGFDKSHINKNAVAAAKQLIAELQKMKPTTMLTPTECLTKAAKDQGDHCKSTGKLSHTGKNGLQIHERLPKFCTKLGFGSENLAAGSVSVRESMLQLLVDGNVPDRGHRKNLLNPDHTMVGVYETGKFNMYATGWVQEFGH
jgi:uncharacterized protein YkwD